MSKQLSRRPLRRTIRFEIQLGREHYAIWTAPLPHGQRGARFVAVLQKMNRPDQFWDRIHNPVLFQKIVCLSAGYTPECQAKHALFQAQHAAYWLLQKRLKANSRSLLKWRSAGNVEPWQAIQPHQLSSVLGNWKAYMEPFGYLGLQDPQTGPLLTDNELPTTNQ